MKPKKIVKKLLSMLIVLTLILQVLPTVFTANATTDWVEYTAVSTKSELNNVRNDLTGKYYLTADIVFTSSDFASGGAFYNDGAGWQPIGANESSKFTGIFDGNGHTITGLYCNMESSPSTFNILYAGLFGYNQGTVLNLGMVNGNIIAKVASSFPALAGEIAGSNSGTISNCYTTGSVNAATTSTASPYAYIGGIVGSSSGTITGCNNTGSVNTTYSSYKAYAGGITGANFGTISVCYNTGDISDCYSGGVAGCNYGSINNCNNTGYVSGDRAGGITEINDQSGTINNCYNTGSILGNNAGGVAAFNNSGTINNCYNTGSVYAAVGGGIVGNNYASIYNCYNAGSVSGQYIGGIVGAYSGTVSNCYYSNINQKGLGLGSGIDTTTSLTQDQMKQQSSFIGFDFSGVWEIDNTAPYQFPTLIHTTHFEKPENTTGFNGGNGTSYNPYQISSKAQLDLVKNDLAASYILISDIVFTASDFAFGGAFYNGGAGWQPIGIDRYHSFTGTFDGNGHTISGLYCNISSTDTEVYAGLFGCCPGVIQNLGMIGGSINATSSSRYAYAGGITGFNYGAVSKCYNSCSVSATSSSSEAYAGGIAGGSGYGTNNTNISTISNCYNTGSISMKADLGHYSWVGGIVGHNVNSNVNYCYNTGNVSGLSNAGGISGTSSSLLGAISNCYYLNNINRAIGDGLSSTDSLTLVQMKQQSSYTGFDFTKVWKIDNTATYQLPTLINVSRVVTVAYNSNGGSAVQSQTVISGRAISAPVPTKAGYTLAGWYTQPDGGTKVNFPYIVTTGVTLYAHWTDSYLPGDIDGNNTVDLLDVTVLSRYIAGWPGLSYNLSTLDVNLDNNVDLMDVTFLSRYVAGWSITIY